MFKFGFIVLGYMLLSLAVFGQQDTSGKKDRFPLRPLGWTSDFEQLFTTEQVAELDSIIGQFERKTTNEIAIVTIDSSLTSGENYNQLILTIGREWGVGKSKIDNGIVIGISAGLRRIRISNGYGIEKKLSDARTKEIIDKVMLPYFKKGDYFMGTKKGLLALMEEIR